MRTAEGKVVLEHIFASAPLVAWAVHPDTHLQLLNDHVHAQLCQHFPRNKARPRCESVSELQWQAIRQRRHTRRLLFCGRQMTAKNLLWKAFCVWKNQPEEAYRRAALQHVRPVLVLRQLNLTVRKLSRTDAANFARKSLAEARGQCPYELA